MPSPNAFQTKTGRFDVMNAGNPQPPRKQIEAIEDITSMPVYSPRKKSAKRKPLFSEVACNKLALSLRKVKRQPVGLCKGRQDENKEPDKLGYSKNT